MSQAVANAEHRAGRATAFERSAVHFGSRTAWAFLPKLRAQLQSEKYMSYSTGCTAWRKRETSPIFSSM